MFETLREAKKTTPGKMFRKLHAEMREAVADLKRCEAAVIQKLQEIDKHLVHRYMGYNSLFQYAVIALGLTEAQSYAYIAVARKAEQYPKLQEAIESGELTVSKAVRITNVIDDRNQERWIELAMTSSKRELEKEVAKVNPRLVQLERVRFVTENTIELQLPISEEIYAFLERAKEIESQRRSAVATTEETLKEVLEFYLDRKDPVRKALRRAKKKTHDKDKTDTAAQEPPPGNEVSSSRSADLCEPEDHPSMSGVSLAHPSASDREFGDRVHSPSNSNHDLNSARAENQETPSRILKERKEIRSPGFRAHGRDGREQGPTMDVQIESTPGSAEWRQEPIAKHKEKQNFRPGQGSSLTRPYERIDLDAATFHKVNLRDQGKCRVVLPDGSVCGERRWTEIHHIVEVCRRGTNDLDNLITVCHGHHRAIHQSSVHH